MHWHRIPHNVSSTANNMAKEDDDNRVPQSYQRPHQPEAATWIEHRSPVLKSKLKCQLCSDILKRWKIIPQDVIYLLTKELYMMLSVKERTRKSTHEVMKAVVVLTGEFVLPVFTALD